MKKKEVVIKDVKNVNEIEKKENETHPDFKGMDKFEITFTIDCIDYIFDYVERYKINYYEKGKIIIDEIEKEVEKKFFPIRIKYLFESFERYGGQELKEENKKSFKNELINFLNYTKKTDLFADILKKDVFVREDIRKIIDTLKETEAKDKYGRLFILQNYFANDGITDLRSDIIKFIKNNMPTIRRELIETEGTKEKKEVENKETKTKKKIKKIKKTK